MSTWDGIPGHGPVDIDPNLPPQLYTGITATQSYTWVLREVFLSTVRQLPFFAGFTIKRNKRVPLQAEDIPVLGVYILDENLVSDGDANASQIDFLNTFKIGFSVVIKNNDDADAEQKLDAAWWAIMNGLWRDQYVTSFWDTWNVHTQKGNPDNTRFEGIINGSRRHIFGAVGSNNEFPTAELQYDTSLTYRSEFAPIITDPLNTIITQTGMGEPPYSDREQVLIVYDFVNPGPPFTTPQPAPPFPPFDDHQEGATSHGRSNQQDAARSATSGRSAGGYRTGNGSDQTNSAAGTAGGDQRAKPDEAGKR
jgi:hypothetical protein